VFAGSNFMFVFVFNLYSLFLSLSLSLSLYLSLCLSLFSLYNTHTHTPHTHTHHTHHTHTHIPVHFFNQTAFNFACTNTFRFSSFSPTIKNNQSVKRKIQCCEKFRCSSEIESMRDNFEKLVSEINFR